MPPGSLQKLQRGMNEWVLSSWIFGISWTHEEGETRTEGSKFIGRTNGSRYHLNEGAMELKKNVSDMSMMK
jgi:hypothetical protein